MEATKRRRVEVLCLTYGEPPRNEFKPQYGYSHAILNRLTRRVAPIPKFVTPLLAARRSRARCEMFNEMGYNSPLDQISLNQAQRLQEILSEQRPDCDFNVRVIFEFWPPYLDQKLKEMEQNPPDELIVLPLYVAESDFTTGISRTDLADYYKSSNGKPKLPKPAYVETFGFNEEFGRYMAEFLWKKLMDAGWTPEKCRDSALILGAHGTLVYPPEGINSGAKETMYVYGLIRGNLRDRFKEVRIGWLNHKLGGKWTWPAADESGQMLWDRGCRKLVYFPFGFLGDNNESQNEGREALKQFDWEDSIYLPCPNEDEGMIQFLARATLRRLDNPMRENWEHIELGGRRDLVQKPRPATLGQPGFLKFNSAVLAAVAVSFWFLGAAVLITRGILTVKELASPLALGLSLFAAIVIGWYKGNYIIKKVALKNLRRLRTLPQPSPLWKFLSKPSWIVISFFMTLGISLRFLGLPSSVYGAILLGVGLSLLVGGVAALRNWRTALPLYVLRMDADRREMQAALAKGLPRIPDPPSPVLTPDKK